MSGDVVFYGVSAGDRAGHYFCDAFGDVHYNQPPSLPRVLALEPSPAGTWCWPVRRTLQQARDGFPVGADETQGRGFIHYAHGWTVLSWWDRSGDMRRGASATFFVRGYHRWTDALRHAREAFPREIARMEAAYDIGLAGADLPDPGDDPAAAVESVVGREVERLRALPPEILAAVLRRVTA